MANSQYRAETVVAIRRRWILVQKLERGQLSTKEGYELRELNRKLDALDVIGILLDELPMPLIPGAANG